MSALRILDRDGSGLGATAVDENDRALLAGTVLELLFSIPAYVRSIQKPDHCNCRKGSCTGLVFAGTTVFWLFGPEVYWLWFRDGRWKPKT